MKRRRARFDYDADAEQDRWIVRDVESEPDPDTWLAVTIDAKDPDDPEPLHALPAPRVPLVYEGNVKRLLEVARKIDRVRAYFLRKELYWLDGVLRSMGMEIAVLRKPSDEG